MRLGLKRDEVRLVDYTAEWNAAFLSVRKKLIENTMLHEKQIEHIGSTAIKGMAAKPIIDIIVGIDDLSRADKTLYKSFSRAGFLRLKVERPGEIVLAKFTDDTYEVKTHYVHLVEYQGELWKNLIFFRDHLNKDEAARNRYLQIKKDYVNNSSTGIKAYTDSKETFVKNIFKKRMQEI